MEVSKKWIEEHTLSEAQMQALRNDPAADARQKMWDEASATQRSAADQKLIVMSLGNGSLVNVPDEKGSTNTSHWRYSADRMGTASYYDLDLYKKLNLKDPAKSTMFDLLPLKHVPGESTADKTSAPFTDAKAYAKTAQDLFNRGQVNGKLSETTLEKLAHDPQLSATERAVAANLKLNNDLINGNAANYYLSKVGLSGFFKDITKNDIERLTHTAAITDVSSAHDVLRHPLGLIETSDSLIKKNKDKPLTEEFLAEVSQSMDYKKFTDRERAAAELLRQNFELFASLDKEPGISYGEMTALDSSFWWADRLKTGTPSELTSITDPESLRGTVTPSSRPKAEVPKEASTRYYSSSSGASSGCNAVASGAVYGLAVYGVLSALGTKGAARYGMAAGAAQAYSTASRCQN